MTTPWRNHHRPRTMDLAFAFVLAPSLLAFLAEAVAAGLPPATWLGVANFALVVVLWFALRWDDRRRASAVAAACAFIAVGFALGMTASAGLHLFVPLIGFANLAFVARGRVAAVVLAVVTALVTAAELALTDRHPVESLAQAALLVAGGSLAIALGTTAAAARRDRDEAVALADRIRELTLAEERARMSREMHDSVGHHLTVASMRLSNAGLLREDDAGRAWTEVDRARTSVAEALEETRFWVRALRPPALDERGLTGALGVLAASPGGARVELASVGAVDDLPAETSLVLYRAAQEGITNAVRHARATRIDVRIGGEGGTATLEVRDDGRGTSGADEGVGLTSLRERAAALDGEVVVASSGPHGTVLTVRLPVPAAPAAAARRAPIGAAP